ncbi:MAG TPA: flagellar basal body M-ring protein FliF [Betaproteobacteria bacterium]|nr:flagellar basal body M-ring protein FliF [Betaproteobacteria bacterium]
MAAAPRQFLQAQLEGFNQLPSGKKLGLMLGLAATIALLVGSWIWLRMPDYRVLYSNLTNRDGGAVLAALQQMNVPYKMAAGGTAILVPNSQVYEARLRLATQGLPRGGNVGFELLDKQKFGISQFQERVDYQRALEGELAQTIESLRSIQSARVHLAIPRPSVFVRNQDKPSASVLLNLYPGRVLDSGQISGIVHLVASGIPDLSFKRVTVVDQNGDLLSQPGNVARAGLEPSQLAYMRQVEQAYIQRIESILAPITGPHNVHAQVSAAIDFSRVEQTAETFKPNPTPTDSAIRSEQTSETTGGGGKAAGGLPGALSNQPPGAASAPITAPTVVGGGQSGSASAPVSKESTINYELDKTIKHIQLPPGSIKRLSVAVVVNDKMVVGKDGKSAHQPFTVDELKKISGLVKEAMGYNAARGDTLNVVNTAFHVSVPEPPLPFWKDPATLDLAREVVKNLFILGMVLFAVFAIIRPLLRAMAQAPRPAQREDEEEVHAAAIKTGGGGYEENVQLIKDFSRQEPSIVANVVKDWVGGSE